MTVWLVRGGRHGEHERRILEEQKIYATWDGLREDVGAMNDRDELIAALSAVFPDTKPKGVSNWASQVWPFAHEMAVGDLVVVPLKTEHTIQIGEIIGNYEFDAMAEDPYFHSRVVKWVGEAIPRSHFGQDLLHTFGAFMTICRVQRNNAESRIEKMRANSWAPESLRSAIGAASAIEPSAEDQLPDVETDLEEAARDQIAQLIRARFKGHNLTRLVDGILRAQGYTTYRSPEGADGGADILAGAGQLGFGRPRLCVEVKSEESAIDRPTVDKLLGAISKFGADEGLFVSWGGYKTTVQKELAGSFFKVRLWSQKDILEAIFANYDKLDDELRAELPLKRIWSVTLQDES